MPWRERRGDDPRQFLDVFRPDLGAGRGAGPIPAGPNPSECLPGPWPGARHRAYWADKAILDGTWTPPNVERLK